MEGEWSSAVTRLSFYWYALRSRQSSFFTYAGHFYNDYRVNLHRLDCAEPSSEAHSCFVPCTFARQGQVLGRETMHPQAVRKSVCREVSSDYPERLLARCDSQRDLHHGGDDDLLLGFEAVRSVRSRTGNDPGGGAVS